jgi:hypothetical protein
VGTVLYPTPTGFGDKFAYNRAYIYGFATNWPHGTINTFVDGVWQLTLTEVNPGAYKYMEFTTDFLSWNSSRWQFSQLWENFYSFIPPGPPIAPEAFKIRLIGRPSTRKLYLALDVTYWTDWYYIDLPAAPPGYWVAPGQ